jgi:hypothetical protein
MTDTIFSHRNALTLSTEKASSALVMESSPRPASFNAPNDTKSGPVDTAH